MYSYTGTDYTNLAPIMYCKLTCDVMSELDVELTTSSVNNVRHDSLRDVAALRRFILRLILFILQNEEKDISYNASDEIIMKALLLSTTKYQNKDKSVNSVVPEAVERHLTDQKVDVRPREVHDIHGPFASEFEEKDGLMGYNEEVQDYGADVRERIPDSVRPYDKETDSRKREDVRSALELEDGAGRDDLVRTAAGVFLRRRAKPLGRSRRWRRNPQDWARMMALNTKCCNLGCVKAEVQATCR